MSWMVISLCVLGVIATHLYAHALPKNLWSFLLSFYYRDIHFHGNLPDDDIATIVVSNHANAFIDPFAVQVALDRPLIRTVRADWLQHWLVKWFARAVGAVPLAGVKLNAPNSNRHSFQTLNKALTTGQWVIVFPEGISHNRSRLKQFKRGAAHMAQQYLKTTGKPIRIIQLGLHYSDKSRLNSDIWVTQAGQTIYTSESDFSDMTAELDKWRESIQSVLPTHMRRQEQKALNWLNQCMSHLNSQTNEFIRDYGRWKNNSQVIQFRSWLRITGLDLSVMQRHTTNRSMLVRILADLTILISGLPLAILGLISHAPVAALHYLLTRKNSQAEDKWASSAYVIGMPLYTTFWLVLIFLLPTAFSLLIILSGPYAVFYWQHWSPRKRALYTCFSCLSQPQTRDTVIDLARESLTVRY